MNRAEILEAARVCVCGEREQDYGKPEDNFSTIGLLWGVYLRAAHPELAKVMGVNRIDAKDVAAMMALLKVARIATGSSPDSFVDLAGYAACAGEIATKEKSAKPDFMPQILGQFVKENQCVMCGAVIPEGRQVCPDCEAGRWPMKAT
jgi:hypothetical protein